VPAEVAVEDVLARCHVVDVPLRVRFRGVTRRQAVLIEGPGGWGEFAPFVEYGDEESARWLAAALEGAWEPQAWPAPVRAAVPVNATLPAVAAARVPAVLERFPGCGTVKVKVAEAGQSLAEDVARVAAVRDVLGSSGRIRVDANGAWTPEEAVRALSVLAPYGLEYAEQPSRTLDDLRAVRAGLARAGVEVPVAADESVRKAGDPLRVALAEAADVVVVKVAPLGGVRAAFEVATTLGADHGLPVVVSSALDTSVGLSAGVALAAALPDLPYACGLGTAALLADDVTARPLLPVRGSVPVRRVAPDAESLAALAAPPRRAAWWRDRLARCHAVLTGSSAST
jgi:o-succinylbenzoate synthase